MDSWFLLNVYFYCGKIGHKETLCEVKVQDAVNSKILEGQFGNWLRASNARLSCRGRGLVGKRGRVSQLLNKYLVCLRGRGVAGDRLR